MMLVSQSVCVPVGSLPLQGWKRLPKAIMTEDSHCQYCIPERDTKQVIVGIKLGESIKVL